MQLSRIKEGLAALGAGPWHLHHLAQTDSTNTRLLEAVGGGGDWDLARTVLVADVQSAGRGRQERSWECPAGQGLLLSLRLDLDLECVALNQLSHWAAWAMLQSLESLCGAAARLWWKWPNDLLLEHADGHGKVAGILVQNQVQGRQARVVVGFGVNLGQRHFPEGLRQPACSLAQAGVTTSREELMAILLATLDRMGPPALDQALPGGLLERDLLASRRAWLRDEQGSARLLRPLHLGDGRLCLECEDETIVLAGGGLRVEKILQEDLWCRLEA